MAALVATLDGAPMPHSPPSSTPNPGAPVDGPLHAETIGQGPRLVMAHGFTQTGRVWGSLDTRLAADHQVVLVDLPGHGGSAPIRATLAQGCRLLADVGGHATYLGYSMGARFCLQLALTRPAVVDGLVLISGTGGLDDPAERRARRRSDEALAAELDPIDVGGPGPVSVESFVGRWLENPMFDGIDPHASGWEERLRNTGPGLASSLRLAGTGTQRPSWPSLGRLSMPVLIVTGERDAKFCALGRRLARSIGSNAAHVVVAGAGHAPHLQRPDAVAQLIRSHLGDGHGR
jgi:2-succinyl-6-hydroxy-2,4-cyclohexadiene-1-carboxylate synthase